MERYEKSIDLLGCFHQKLDNHPNNKTAKEKSERATTYNKPIAYMVADVITQAYVLRKSISDYPQCNLHETATMQLPKR